MLIRLQDYENFLVIEKAFPFRDEDYMVRDKIEDLSVGSEIRNEEDISRVIEP